MIEALKLALEALDDKVINEYKVVKAITAIKVALAQEQEPVAWMYVNTDGECEQIEYGEPFDDPSTTPLFTHPPQRTWVGLTNEEVELYWDWEDFQCGCGSSTLFAMVRDIEARLKDRNI